MTRSPSFLRFGVVGTVGFAVDSAIVLILVSQGVDALLARAFSFPTAVVVTWWLNRNWTFAATSNASSKRQFTTYFLIQIIGIITNFAVYAVILHFIGVSPIKAFFALGFGALVSLVVNFSGSRLFVFSPDVGSTERTVE